MRETQCVSLVRLCNMIKWLACNFTILRYGLRLVRGLSCYSLQLSLCSLVNSDLSFVWYPLLRNVVKLETCSLPILNFAIISAATEKIKFLSFLLSRSCYFNTSRTHRLKNKIDIFGSAYICPVFFKLLVKVN